ncbi:TetR family transcriptional regulator [Streptomyces sp. NPDC050803]|uniref:TetR/AcrR family transcriptional regulator n=1 Tax=unclassified Streptomyces TaxID=2593676 RepID=UPI00343FBF09
MPSKNDSPEPSKSEQTRALILETAMRLFQERGYDKTTMRAIAKEAGVSVGNAYYYFEGKEHLIQGFYDRIAAEHKAAVREVLARETDLEARLAGVLKAWLDVATPYHEFAVQFFKTAADPDSPLSPFSPESEHARVEAIEVHREVLAGATKTKVPDDLRDVLPELMWLSQMGLVLYWIFDRTAGRERSYKLAARGARLTARGVALARFRVLRPLVREVHELFTDFLPGMTKVMPNPGRKP